MNDTQDSATGQPSGGWTRIYNGAIERAKEVGPAAFLVYAVIAKHTDSECRAWPGIDRLAEITGLSNRWIKRSIKTLEAVGWIRVLRSRGSRNVYSLPPVESREPQFPSTNVSREPQCTTVVNSSSPGSEVECTTVVNSSSPEQDPRTRPKNKTQGTRPKRGCAAEVVFPSELDSEAFRTAWDRWTTHRKEIRHPLTPTSVEMQLKELAGWGEERAIAAIEHSIKKGWQGIFEPKEDKKNAKHDQAGAIYNGQPKFESF